MTEKVKGIWIGATGATPDVGFTIHGEEISLIKEKFDKLEERGLVKAIVPETKTLKKVKE